MGKEDPPAPSSAGELRIKVQQQQQQQERRRRGDGGEANGHGGVFAPFKKWVAWLVPCFVAANIVIFGVTMYVNDCPKNSSSCVARFLGRFSFQPLKENPLLGPSSNT